MSEKTKKSWKPNALTWLVISGVVLINVAVFFSGDIHRVTIHHWIYRFDFRYWPIPLGIAFWIIFAWLAMNTLFHVKGGTAKVATAESKCSGTSKGQKNARIIISLFNICVIVTLFYFVATAFYTRQEIQRWLYFSVLVPFYFEPMTMFFYDFTMTKRLVIPPLTAIFAIGFLLYLNRIFKKRGSHDTTTRQ